jgi:hypothetical protein
LSKPIKVRAKDVPGTYLFEGHDSRDELILAAEWHIHANRRIPRHPPNAEGPVETPGRALRAVFVCHLSGAISRLPTSSSSPHGIVAGSDGNLWFTDWGANDIGRITPDGTVTKFPIPTANSSPACIAVGPDRNLWFTEANAGKIARLTP